MKKRMCCFLAFTILILSSGGVFALADGTYKMKWNYPQPGDDMIYHWEMEKQVENVDFSDVAMYLTFDVGKSENQHLVKALWLPETDDVDADGMFYMNQSFYDHLEFHSMYQEDTDIYGRDIYELLAQSGLTEQEARDEWFTEIEAQTTHTFPYRIEIFDNYRLYGRDLIQGAYGAKAVNVEDSNLGNWQMIKATIDYTPIYDDIPLSADDWENVKKSVIKNYIYLFDNEEEYMICISGTSDMEVLEKIADNLQVRETALIRKTYNDGLDYIFNDMGKG